MPARGAPSAYSIRQPAHGTRFCPSVCTSRCRAVWGLGDAIIAASSSERILFHLPGLGLTHTYTHTHRHNYDADFGTDGARTTNIPVVLGAPSSPLERTNPCPPLGQARPPLGSAARRRRRWQEEAMAAAEGPPAWTLTTTFWRSGHDRRSGLSAPRPRRPCRFPRPWRQQQQQRSVRTCLWVSVCLCHAVEGSSSLPPRRPRRHSLLALWPTESIETPP